MSFLLNLDRGLVLRSLAVCLAFCGSQVVQAAELAHPPRFLVHLAPAMRTRLGIDNAGSGWPADARLIVVLAKGEGGEPRYAIEPGGMNSPVVIGRDVRGLDAGSIAVLDERCTRFPFDRLSQIPAGDYAVQALLHRNRDLNLLNAPGDLYSRTAHVRIRSEESTAIDLELTESVPEESFPVETELVKFVRLRSRLLSAFHGRPIDLRAGIILPRDHGRDPGRRYPLRVHIGGYGSRFTGVGGMMTAGSPFRAAWLANDAPRMILLHLDGAGPLGDPYQIDSANHGPYGAALTQELIPHVERLYGGRGDGKSRVLDGGSTGGWVALALQVFYPDFFNGAWSFCPDSVDFHSFQLVNIYDDENAYVNSRGFERPGARETSGEVRYTMRHELRLENVLGLGDSWTMSGGQWGAWNAAYGPRGGDGRPVPLWDPRTGVINRRAADAWKRYDLRQRLANQWAELAPRLNGKIHIWVGDADDYFLNNAVHRLDAFLRRAQPRFDGLIRYKPGQGHCWIGVSESEMMKQMAARTAE